MKLYDLLWKKSETNGKARWEKIGRLIDKGDKKSIKVNMLSVSKDWSGTILRITERPLIALATKSKPAPGSLLD